MNYTAHYDRLIDRAHHRVLDGYFERHHATPRCMGGNDSKENLVDLTAEEHYVAHQLLVKINPGIVDLVSAAFLMSGRAGHNKAYGWLRRRYSVDKSNRMMGNKYRLGKPQSDETKAKIGAASLGNKNMLGKKFSTESRARMSEIGKKKIFAKEHRENLSIAAKRREARPGMKERRSANALSNAKFMAHSRKRQHAFR